MNVDSSEHIDELVTALSKAQLKFKPIPKRGNNPYFESSYALLEDIIEATKPSLAEHGLAVIQLATNISNAAGVTTLLTHSSGQWIKGVLLLPPKDNSAQGFGACITYARRYALSAILNVDSEVDDDGNQASQTSKQTGTSGFVAVTSNILADSSGDYIIQFGRDKGKKLKEFAPFALAKDLAYWKTRGQQEKLSGMILTYMANAEVYLNSIREHPLQKAEPKAELPDYMQPPNLTDTDNIPF